MGRRKIVREADIAKCMYKVYVERKSYATAAEELGLKTTTLANYTRKALRNAETIWKSKSVRAITFDRALLALVYRFDNNKSYGEIASDLGISKTTAVRVVSQLENVVRDVLNEKEKN